MREEESLKRRLEERKTRNEGETLKVQMAENRERETSSDCGVRAMWTTLVGLGGKATGGFAWSQRKMFAKDRSPFGRISRRRNRRDSERRNDQDVHSTGET